MQLLYLRMAGITAGTIRSTIGTDHIVIVGRGIGTGITHTIGVGDIHIITICIVLLTISRHITVLHTQARVV